MAEVTRRQDGPSAVRRGRVLLIDDEPSVRRAMSRMLAFDYDVVAVGGGHEALARLRAGERFDAILCDLMMPAMTGSEFFQELSRTLPDLVDSVIFVTGGAVTPAAQDFLERVPYHRIEKPFDAERLLTLLRERLQA